MGSGASSKHNKEVVIGQTQEPHIAIVKGSPVKDTGTTAFVKQISPAGTAAAKVVDVKEASEAKAATPEDACQELTAEPQYEGEKVATKGDESSVCRTRRGCFLRYQTILKCDQFPSAQNSKLTEKLADVANFRQVDGSKVFGVGQAGIAGHTNVMQRVLKTDGVDKVMWFNMREEPIIFVNKKPYCVKDRRCPFANQEATGINTTIVESVEDGLVKEILEEAARFDGKILLHGETKPPPGSEMAAFGKAYCYWETVSPESVMTMRSLANSLVSQGYPLTFHRIPITDENSPEMKDFDQILTCLNSADASTGLVFNCQLGRGRTTTGMALAIMLQSLIDRVPKRAPDMRNQESGDLFVAVAKLVRMIDGATAGKAVVDEALDRCKHLQHLRDAIVAKRGTKHEKVGLCYLERYIFLILFKQLMLRVSLCPLRVKDLRIGSAIMVARQRFSTCLIT